MSKQLKKDLNIVTVKKEYIQGLCADILQTLDSAALTQEEVNKIRSHLEAIEKILQRR